MPKAGFIVARVSFLVLAASMLGAAMLAAPAAGQTPSCAPPSGKCFAVAVSPGAGTTPPSSPAAGASTSFAFTIMNEASTQQLGSVQISAPAGFVITSAPGAASVTSSSALFLNLSLAPSATTTLTVNATVSCNRSSSTYQWGIEAKQSNDFNGTGNDVQLDSNSAGNLSGTLTGCTFQPCPPQTQCSASASSVTTSGTVTIVSSLPPGDTLVTGMESGSAGSPFNFSCGTTPPVYTPVSDVFNFAVFKASGDPEPGISLSVTLRIDKSLVTSSGHPGASSWQICYASTKPFNTLAGTSQQNVTIGGSPGYFTGLLPDCSSTPGTPPCVQTRNKNNAGDVIVTFLALGDPYGHG
jgi:hypothetical protein